MSTHHPDRPGERGAHPARRSESERHAIDDGLFAIDPLESDGAHAADIGEHIAETRDERDPHAHGFGRVTNVLEGIGAVIVLLLALGVTVSVVARNLGYAITGVIELGALSLVLITFLGFPALALRDGHVKVEILDIFLKPRAARIVDVFSLVLQVLIAAALLWVTFDLMTSDLARGTTFGGDLKLPRSLVAIVCFAGALTGLGALIVRTKRHGRGELPESTSVVTTAGDAEKKGEVR